MGRAWTAQDSVIHWGWRPRYSQVRREHHSPYVDWVRLRIVNRKSPGWSYTRWPRSHPWMLWTASWWGGNFILGAKPLFQMKNGFASKTLKKLTLFLIIWFFIFRWLWVLEYYQNCISLIKNNKKVVYFETFLVTSVEILNGQRYILSLQNSSRSSIKSVSSNPSCLIY